MKKMLLASALLLSSTLPAHAADSSIYIIEPANGAEVSSPVTVKFGLKGMGVAPAGVEKANTGHHHMIIDAELPDLSKPIPKDEHHKHFGGGQTETEITLAPGKHSIQLLLGDHSHTAHKKPVVSEKITITVK